MIIEGKSDVPVYLYIRDKQVEIKDASQLWGLGALETTDHIQKEIADPDASVAVIGQAGENQVLFAAVINDRGRAAGRAGGGAVLGAKNLKAVAVNGTQTIEVKDPEGFRAAVLEAENNLSRYPFEGVNQLGTPLLVSIMNGTGSLPTKNFELSQFKDAYAIGAESLTTKHLIKRRACYGCSMACGRYTVVEDGEWRTPPGEGPEYETIDMLGAMSCNNDLAAIIHANHLCNDLGLDTISTGAAISFAIDCYEKGVIKANEFEECPLRWGDASMIVRLVQKIAHRDGLGDLLANGVKRAAERLGDQAEDCALHVKGLEVPGHDPRGESKVMALQYAVSPRGACHMHPNWAAVWDSGNFECGMRVFGLPWPPTDKYAEVGYQKGLAYRYISVHGEISEVVGACVFHSFGPADSCITPSLYARMLQSLTGFAIDEFELFKAADRSWVMKRCFNTREGFRRKDDVIPNRLRRELADGPAKGQAVTDVDGMIDEYFEACGWDQETGIPKVETLQDLGLFDVAEDLALT